ncbi:MAG: Uma2 family endonuclease, partial [Bryobacteraceae bacterium]
WNQARGSLLRAILIGSMAELVTIEEYLHSTFEHDAEYVEGRIVPRPDPQRPHSKMQGYLVRRLCPEGDPLGYAVWPEQRIRTQRTPARYRVPDLCVTQGEPSEDVFTEPPFLCVEIPSPDDRAVDLWAKSPRISSLRSGLCVDCGSHYRHGRDPLAGGD